MIRGETVTVTRRVETGRDDLNSPIYATREEAVDDVLVAPGPRADVDGSNRPEGIRIAYTLHFPRSYVGDLAGASVSIRGGPPLPVVGHPDHYTGANTPGRWSMPVEVEAVDG